MEYIRLGNSGLKVSQLCVGTWHLPVLPEVDEYGVHKVDKETTIRILKKAYDLGITFYDTANRYAGSMQTADLNHVGTAERILGEFLKNIDRESIIIATKVRGKMAFWPHGEGLSRKHIMWQIKESL
ncbi:MAG: aldo/keto reductase, partial [Sulfolobus sp.]|nr:aldo/keto reductase [Sulfolobus sp.]